MKRCNGKKDLFTYSASQGYSRRRQVCSHSPGLQEPRAALLQTGKGDQCVVDQNRRERRCIEDACLRKSRREEATGMVLGLGHVAPLTTSWRATCSAWPRGTEMACGRWECACKRQGRVDLGDMSVLIHMYLGTIKRGPKQRTLDVLDDLPVAGCGCRRLVHDRRLALMTHNQ